MRKEDIFYQENSGQSVAIKNGLQLIKGEYLAWPDSDDFYASPEAIAKMVDRLANASSEFAMVRTMERFVDENTLEELFVVGQNANEEETKTLFEDCLFNVNSFYYPPGAYMIIVSKLREVTSLNIYTEKEAGQNWQLYLPILYSYRCLTIKEVLYNVLFRKMSHSRGLFDGYERILLRINVYERTVLNTLDKIHLMSNECRNEYKSLIQKKYNRERFYWAYSNKKRDDVVKFHRYCQANKYSILLIDKMRFFAAIFRIESIFEFFLKYYRKLK